MAEFMHESADAVGRAPAVVRLVRTRVMVDSDTVDFKVGLDVMKIP